MQTKSRLFCSTRSGMKSCLAAIIFPCKSAPGACLMTSRFWARFVLSHDFLPSCDTFFLQKVTSQCGIAKLPLPLRHPRSPGSLSMQMFFFLQQSNHKSMLLCREPAPLKPIHTLPSCLSVGESICNAPPWLPIVSQVIPHCHTSVANPTLNRFVSRPQNSFTTRFLSRPPKDFSCSFRF